MQIFETNYNIHIANYKKRGYNEYEAQMLTMKELSDKYGFFLRS